MVADDVGSSQSDDEERVVGERRVLKWVRRWIKP